MFCMLFSRHSTVFPYQESLGLDANLAAGCRAGCQIPKVPSLYFSSLSHSFPKVFYTGSLLDEHSLVWTCAGRV